ncbi:uncharacterized protein [Nothobranchius furzeri]|uniref:uncharacterized protein n=1 Tax=Nothobranchius furzeri TaxID=105023 RepID=UPI003904C10D
MTGLSALWWTEAITAAVLNRHLANYVIAVRILVPLCFCNLQFEYIRCFVFKQKHVVFVTIATDEPGIFIVERPVTAGVPEVIRILDEDEGRYPALHIPDDDVVFVGHGQAPPVEAEFAFEGLSSDEESETDISSDWSALDVVMASSEDSGYGSSVLDSDEDQQLPPPDFWLAVAPPAPPGELPEDPRPAHGSAEEVEDVEEPTPSTSVLGSSQKRTGERFPYIPPKRPRWDDSDDSDSD